nr:MAG TPA: holin protein [Caudoviricetes sp.]
MERAIIIAVFASTGLWSFISMLVQRYMERKSDYAMMMRGLGHDRICYLGEYYIKRGCITRDEYENLVDYLYIPYKRLGGNGTAEKVINEVKQLPLKDNCNIE